MGTPRKQRWLQFSLRTLLAFFVAAALFFGYLASLWQAHQRKVVLVQEVEARGGWVGVKARGPDWVRRIGGYHKKGIQRNPRIGILDRAVEVRFRHGGVTDDFLPRLDGFPDLKLLHLKRCAITNDGLRHVARLTSLEELDLSYTAITDDCLPHVGKLTRLRELDLGHTRVCGRGFHRLEALSNLEVLNLVFTPIQDEALERLKAIPTLSLVNVWACRHLSRQGTEGFQATRPDCRLFGLHTLEPHWARREANGEGRHLTQ